MQLWLDEFGAGYQPDAVVEDLLSIKGVADESWHNNVSPNFSFERDSFVVELWFDHPDRAQRETGDETARYRVYEYERQDYSPDYATSAYEGDDACAAVRKFLELTHLPMAVGDKFAKLLRAELTAQELSEVRARNAVETHEGCCHSHDFCDANMPMAEALQIVCGCEPSFEHDAITELWNLSWDYAKREHLTARRAR